MTRISVIVCAHNEAAYLPARLYSLLAQTRRPDEIIVINNASTDETRAVAAQIRSWLRGRKNFHIIALDIKKYISLDQRADDVLREIRRQGALSIACHPHHRTMQRIEISTCYLCDHRDELSDLVDVREAANRDDLFSVTSLKHFPYVANSDFHKPRHLYSWKTLVRSEKTWPAIKQALRANVDIALTLFRKDSWAA